MEEKLCSIIAEETGKIRQGMRDLEEKVGLTLKNELARQHLMELKACLRQRVKTLPAVDV